MRTITLPVFNRNDKLKQLIDSLRRCKSINEYVLYVNVEHDYDENVYNQILDIDFMNKSIKLKDTRKGLDLNTELVLHRAFNDGSDFNLHIEDDLILSPDAILLCNWYYEQFKNRPMEYLAYGLFNFNSNPLWPDKVLVLPNSFTGWGWCMFRDMWFEKVEPIMLSDLAEKIITDKYVKGWDWNVSALAIRDSLNSLTAFYSRSRHNGEGGIHWSNEEHKDLFGNIPYNTELLINEFEVI